jgi:hypothetical protein
MLLAEEVVEERSVGHLAMEVLTPHNGYVRVTHVCRTIPMEVWRVSAGEHSMECSGRHLVVTAANVSIRVDQLTDGCVLLTETGPERVSHAAPTGDVREMFDIRVDSSDHLFYSSGIASHNSTGLCAAELFKLNVLDRYRALYITPLREQSKTIADKMLDMQRASVFPPHSVTSKGYRNNHYYKESVRGGWIKLLHILTDPSKIRGNSCPSVVIDEAQDFDPDHLLEVTQVQKAFANTRMTMFAGTSKDKDTCLEYQFEMGSGGVWHVRCGCKDGWHSLGDPELVPKLMGVEGLNCPNQKNKPLDPEYGEFVHASRAQLNMNNVSFHLPQVIVPEYARGAGFLDIWSTYKKNPLPKFLREVWGLATESGYAELTEADLKKNCCEYTFEQLQQRYLSGKDRYFKLFSGVDWGGSDHDPSLRTKVSFTLHVIFGMRGDGKMVLLHARRYHGMNYMEIAESIVHDHRRLNVFAMGTDNGGGAYYNAYMRDCGKIPSGRIIHFHYTDTSMFINRIPHPEAHIMSLHRTDSLSALIADIKSTDVIWPRWDVAQGFLNDCLNVRRNLTEIPSSGRKVMRYIRTPSKADDFFHAANYAFMMKRIVAKEPTIPNQQLIDELARMFGMQEYSSADAAIMDYLGDYVGG